MAKEILFRINVENAQQIVNVNKEIDRLTKIRKAQLETQQKLIAQGKQEGVQYQTLTKAISRNLAKTEQLRQQKQQLNLTSRNVAKSVNAESGSINELAARYNLLVQRIRNTNRSTKKGQAQFDNLTREAKELNDELKRLESSYGSNARNVGNYTQSINQSGIAAGKFALQLIGITSAIAIMQQGIRRVITTQREFQDSQSRLQALVGGTTEELQALTNQALKLGETTQFTASEISDLQVELGKLGFTTQEILDSTEAIQSLALITNSELAGAAEIAGSTLRAFNLNANQSKRVVDVLAKAFSSSALDITKFENAVTKVAPVAATFGFSIEETVALLGELANAGFTGEQAGTALRNILLNLADSGGKLAQELGEGVDTFEELIPALIKLRDSGVDLNTTLELTDKRSVAAFNTFLRGAENADKLKMALDGANGAAKEQSDIIGDTLTGDLARFNSALDGAILKQGGLNSLLRQAVQLGTSYLSWANETPKSLEDFQQELSDLNKELETLEASGNASAAAIGELQSKIEGTQRTIDVLTTQIQTVSLDGMQLFVSTTEESRKTFADFVAEIGEETDLQTLSDQLADLNDLQDDFAKSFGPVSNEVLLVQLRINALVERLQALQSVTGGGDGEEGVIVTLTTLNNELKDLKDAQLLVNVETAEGVREYRRLEDAIFDVNEQIRLFKLNAAKLGDDLTPIDTSDLVTGVDSLEGGSPAAQIVSGDPAEFEEAKAQFNENLERSLQEEGELIRENRLGVAAEVFNQTQEFLNIADQAAEVRLQNQLNRIERQREAEINAAQNSIQDEQVKAAKIANINTKFDQQKLQEERKAARKRKAISLTQAIIGTAQAVIQALNFAPPASFIFSALAGAIGAAQIGLIAGQKFKDGGRIPFKEGGIIKGNSHANGGVKFTAGGRLMEAEGGEAILNKSQQSKIGYSNLARAGVPGFKNGGVIPYKYQTGGVIPNVNTNMDTTALDLRGVISEEIRTLQVVNNATETSRTINTVNSQVTDSTFSG